MPEERESKVRIFKRIKPGVILSVFVMMISALLIYKIQSMESIHPQHEPLSLPMSEESTTPNRYTAKLSPRDDNVALDKDPAKTAQTKTKSLSDPIATLTENRLGLLPDVKTVHQRELDSSSWQNPFQRQFWRSNGWKFTADEMVSSVGKFSAATFVRPYKRISVSFQVRVKPKFPSFELQLLTRDPAKPNQVLIASQIHFQNDVVRVFACKQETTQELKQEKLSLDSKNLNSVPIRFVGTGNRFVISVAGQRVLACAQPAQQSGRECFLSFLTNKDQLHISALRIEGE